VPTVSTLEHLDAGTQAEVRALADRVEAAVGAPPLNDQALAQLGDTAPGLRHLLVASDGRVEGYAQLDGQEVAVVGAPEVLDPLLAAAESAGPEADLLVWSHGATSPVGPVARQRGYTAARTLWQLRRPLTDLPAAPVPAGVAIRPFVPGQDEDAWLAVNAAAFAGHPEQGRWTRRDLAAREAEPWFDPAGFLLAERTGAVIGYHWTKVHPDGLGEVYVLGVDPAAQGLRLGPALLAAGLLYLTRRGAPTVLLYVEGDNEKALGLYRRFGFERYDRDVQYRRPLAPRQRS
jgi:mycothiol synthase